MRRAVLAMAALALAASATRADTRTGTSTAQPSTAQPSTAQPSTAQPSTAQPSTAQPSTAQRPTAQRPTAQRPTAQRPTTQPSTAQPSTAHRPTAQPSTSQPPTAQPSTAQPPSAQPPTAQPPTAQPPTAQPSAAQPLASSATLVALVPEASNDDARKSIAIGARGEVFEPDGKGAWVRRQRTSTSESLSIAGRAGDAVIGWGNGIVYRLAANGWSAIRLHQKERAVASGGVRAIAAVGRQLFALDKTVNGEPAKLAVAPSNVIAIGAGPRGVIVQLDRGLFRLQGARVGAIANAPKAIAKVVSDRWVLVADGAIDLKTGRKTGFPPTSTVVVAAMMEDERLVLVVRNRDRAGLDVVTLKDSKLERTPLDIPPSSTGAVPEPVGIVLDRSNRIVVAMRDGQIVMRDAPTATWTTTTITEAVFAAKPGPAPARSR
jgi:hypothetical protein